MAFPFYLAMTAAEYFSLEEKPPYCAWMACHFSPYGTGLSNIPCSLPPGSMLILNDRTPIHRHDPQCIIRQLRHILDKFSCDSLLLDFQRQDQEETFFLVDAITKNLPCPVGVSHLYAGAMDCPVFLPSIPPDVLPDVYLAPWKGRQIWLEAALDALEITVTEQGSQLTPVPYYSQHESAMQNRQLHCHYQVQLTETSASFRLFRTREDLESLQEEAENLGISRMIGLYQELG